MHEKFPLPDVNFEPLKEFWAAAARKELRLPWSEEENRFVWYPTEKNITQKTGQKAEQKTGQKGFQKSPSPKYEWRQVSGKGSLFSWAVVTHAFLPQYKPRLPFITALVAIEEDPSVRLPTQITGVEDPAMLTGDMPVGVVFETLEYETGSLIAPFFTPV